MMYGSPSATATKDLNLAFCFRKGEADLQRQQQMSSGLLRYRSAPSSVLGDACENFIPVRSSSPETESMFVRLLSPDLRDKHDGINERDAHFKSPAAAEQNSVFSIAPHHFRPSDGANLIRQNSSPAGFYSHLNADNCYSFMRGITAAAGIKGQINFASRQNSLSQISEMGDDAGGSPEETGNGRCFIPVYPASSWEDPILSDTFSDFKRARDEVILNQTEIQNGELKTHQVPGLTHQFSLPKTSSEMAAIEKFLQFQDSVPCKIRAKRGCATHPRSIAERVRRTRISERMRKLQELVPNMDKQTNTSDMLDLAVDYIKDLQKQVKTLADCRAACTCLASKQKPYHNQTR